MPAIYTPATLPENLKHRDTNKLTYTPSLAGVYTRIKWNIRWWGEGAPFQHPALLISAFNGVKYWDFRDKFEIPRKEFLFFADSGGYQNFSQGLYADPLEILKWMEHNADIGVMLDLPPDFETSATMGKKLEEHCAKSLANYEKMDKNRENYDMKLFKPLHGNTAETLGWWHKQVEDIPCEGYASSPRRPSAEMAAFTLSFAIDRGLDNFHLFLGTGFNVIPVIAYASRYIKDLSFDSSSFSLMGGRLRQYILPIHTNVTIPFGRQYIANLDRLPCFCPICVNVLPSSMNEETAEGAGLILLHDLYVYLLQINTFNALSTDKDKFREVVKKNFPEQTNHALDLLDLAADGQFEDVWEKKKEKTTIDLAKFF